MADSGVKLTHPDGGSIEVSSDQVEKYESQGWETADTKKK